MATANTKRIKLLTGIAGNHIDANGHTRQFAYIPGTELEWDAKEADRFVAAGYAQFIKTADGK